MDRLPIGPYAAKWSGNCAGCGTWYRGEGKTLIWKFDGDKVWYPVNHGPGSCFSMHGPQRSVRPSESVPLAG